jgi:hypothetical protein
MSKTIDPEGDCARAAQPGREAAATNEDTSVIARRRLKGDMGRLLVLAIARVSHREPGQMNRYGIGGSSPRFDWEHGRSGPSREENPIGWDRPPRRAHSQPARA